MVRGSCLHEHISSHGLLPRRFCAYESINKPSTGRLRWPVTTTSWPPRTRRVAWLQFPRRTT